MLATILNSQRAQFEALAEAWLAMGAVAFSVWSKGQLLAHWPAGPPPETHNLATSIHLGKMSLGELRVAGLSGHVAQNRLDVDALLVTQLLKLEHELEDMTGELIDGQDQLLALYNLTQSTRSQLDINQTLYTLAREAMRLVKTEFAFTVLAPPDSQPILTQYPDQCLQEADLRGFFHQVQASGRKLILNANSASANLPEGIQNMLLTPIRICGEISVGMGLMNKPGGIFTSPDLKLVQAISEQAGAQIENVLLYQETLEQAKMQTEMDLAKRVQGLLLPQNPPQVEGLDLFAASIPALQVGGDFYDFISLPGRPFIFTVGDVTGKGMPAAMLMSMTRTSIRSKASFLPAPTPEIVLNRSNKDLYDDFTSVSMFVTVFVGQYDPANNQLLYANAGHSPVIYCPSGGQARLLEADGTAVGVLPESLSQDQRIDFNPGDVLIIATDGFSEASNPDSEMFGYEQLLSLVKSLSTKSAGEIAKGLFDTVNTFSAGHPQDDDQTLIVVKRETL